MSAVQSAIRKKMAGEMNKRTFLKVEWKIIILYSGHAVLFGRNKYSDICVNSAIYGPRSYQGGSRTRTCGYLL